MIVGLGFPAAMTLKLSLWPTLAARLSAEAMRGAAAVGVTGLPENAAAGPVPTALIAATVMS